MRLLSREGVTLRPFCSRLDIQSATWPLPWVASCHICTTAGFSSSRSMRTTLRATRSLLMMSTCVPMVPGAIPVAESRAATGSGERTSTISEVSALYRLVRFTLTPAPIAKVRSATISATL